MWLLLSCSAAAIVIAMVPCAGLLVSRAQPGSWSGPGPPFFRFCRSCGTAWPRPGAKDRGAASSASRTRFALRSLALALVVLGVSLGDVGTTGSPESCRHHRPGACQAAGNAGRRHRLLPRAAASQPIARHGLESFIRPMPPWWLGWLGSAAMEQLLAATGVDTRDKLAALATCKIDLESARILIAAARKREPTSSWCGPPGFPTNGTCMVWVGVMGSDRLQIRTEGTGASRTLVVNGFLSRSMTLGCLTRRPVDRKPDEAWQNAADRSCFPAGDDAVEGRLALPLARVDRSATLWSASVRKTAAGHMDLALHGSRRGKPVKLQGSSIPPREMGPG